jgi:cytoskeletal protein CcmA (bactofilin family)
MGLFRNNASEGIRDFERLRHTLRPAAARGPADQDDASGEERHESNITVRVASGYGGMALRPVSAAPEPVEVTSSSGVLRVDGDLAVDANLVCDVEVTGRVVVGQLGRIDGGVRASAVDVAGRIIGDVTCNGRVEVGPTGRVTGEVIAGRLVVHEGAAIEGRVRTSTAADPGAPDAPSVDRSRQPEVLTMETPSESEEVTAGRGAGV